MPDEEQIKNSPEKEMFVDQGYFETPEKIAASLKQRIDEEAAKDTHLLKIKESLQRTLGETDFAEPEKIQKEIAVLGQKFKIGA